MSEVFVVPLYEDRDRHIDCWLDNGELMIRVLYETTQGKRILLPAVAVHKLRQLLNAATNIQQGKSEG